ncbi:hypothetical protein MettiDRAFT_0860 [Methanolobus tindarius DSM 2278]|uniref:Uncharacterized protein n=1 Tax=Methanolobus tindarius DSM 2278 TaxID=1090322 RepID=W9DVI3_METTI|nr:hypothetical protein [Methanolobus tindarius]ETA67436.1 hypothetical protein MettiDRAFT_0860 [Methanolobus tindarius DSM 2278]
MSKKNQSNNEDKVCEDSRHHLLDLSSLVIIVALAFSTIFYLWDIIFSSNMLAGNPTDMIEFPVFSQIQSIIVYHQIPLWDNLWLGGFPEYASPISALYNPLVTIPYFMFGLIAGSKVIVVLHVFLAGVCFWIFSTTITSRRSLQLYGSFLFMLSGTLITRVNAGHTELLTTQMFIPLSLFFVMKAVESRNIVYVICSAISISMFIFGGAIYYFVFFMMMFLVYSIVTCFEQTDSKKFKLNTTNLKIISFIFILTIMFSSIKLIPALFVSDNIVRIDPIDPLKGSGLFRDMFTSFVTGNYLEGYSVNETYSYLGFLPFIFAIVSLFHNAREKIFYYISFLVFLLWAGGSNNLMGVLRYFPFFENFRVPGRSLLFASFIVISLSIYGIQWFFERLEKEDNKSTKPVFWLIGFVLLFEIQEILLNSAKVAFSNVGIGFFGLLLTLLISLYVIININGDGDPENKTLFILIFMSIFLISAINIATISPHENNIENSTSLQIMQQIKDYDNDTHQQIWLTTDGWPYYHMDFTYAAMKNDLHMQRSYYGYFLDTVPSTVQIGNTSYYAANYLVDTQYLESGETIDAPAILSVNGVSVVEIPESLPNVFSIRGNSMMPLDLKYFSPNKVVVDGSLIQAGDVVVYKCAYYDGWKANGMTAENMGNMVGTTASTSGEDLEFVFDPIDFKIGLLITLITIFIFIVSVIKKDKVNSYLKE